MAKSVRCSPCHRMCASAFSSGPTSSNSARVRWERTCRRRARSCRHGARRPREVRRGERGGGVTCARSVKTRQRAGPLWAGCRGAISISGAISICGAPRPTPAEPAASATPTARANASATPAIGCAGEAPFAWPPFCASQLRKTCRPLADDGSRPAAAARASAAAARTCSPPAAPARSASTRCSSSSHARSSSVVCHSAGCDSHGSDCSARMDGVSSRYRPCR